MEIISCKDAKAKGLTRYFTGKPCKRGHVAERYTRTSNCLQCDNQRPVSINHRDTCKKWYDNRTNEQIQKSRLQTRVENMTPEQIATRNSGAILYSYKRSKRVPKWSQTDKIRQFYMDCPPDCHVDHIIPLCGTLVSGLHVLENLQYLPAQENLKKGNKYDPD